MAKQYAESPNRATPSPQEVTANGPGCDDQHAEHLCQIVIEKPTDDDPECQALDCHLVGILAGTDYVLCTGLILRLKIRLV